MISNIREMQKRIHVLNHRWWHDEQGNRLDRNKGELLCLIHSEGSEATEGVIEDLMDDKLQHRRMDEVEMADQAIRIFDYAEDNDYDLEAAEPTVLLSAAPYFEYMHLERIGSVVRLAQHAIIHLHVSKAMESERKGRDDAVNWLRGALHWIDVYCRIQGYNLAGAIEEKLDYNAKRVDHTYAARAQANGKKW